MRKGEESKPHRFDGRRLDSITHGELKAWLQEVANTRGDGVAHSVQSLTGKMFSRAMDYDIVMRDPTRGLGKVKRKRTTVQRLQREEVAKAKAEGREVAVAKDHQRALSADDITRLFAYLEEDSRATRNGLALIARVMFGTGLRIGEAIALQWEDLDLDSTPPTLSVNATVSRRPGEGLYLQPWTKTEEGHRVVEVPLRLADMLKEHRTQDRERARLEPSWNALGLVFPSERGTIRDTSNTHDKFRGAFDAKDVGLQWATPHVFRRTYATMLLNLGTPPLAVAYYLGHTDPAFTLKTYGDWTSAPRVDGTVLEELFRAAPGTRTKALESAPAEAK